MNCRIIGKIIMGLSIFVLVMFSLLFLICLMIVQIFMAYDFLGVYGAVFLVITGALTFCK